MPKVEAGQPTPDVVAGPRVKAATVPAWVASSEANGEPFRSSIQRVIHITRAMLVDPSMEDGPPREMTPYRAQTPCNAGSRPPFRGKSAFTSVI
jgi:hypothetical protein